jgi:predicted O-linked N-acetylglucosamine transferase (SPINDLY family)
MSDLLKKAEEFLNKGELQEAVSILEAALEKERPELLELLMSAHIAYLQKSYDKARESIARAEELYPNDFRTHFMAGQIYEAQEKKIEAIKSYEAAIKIAPDHSNALSNLAHILSEFGNLHIASGLFKRAMEAEPGNIRAKTLSIKNMAATGDISLSVKTAKEVLDIDPFQITAYSAYLLNMHYNNDFSTREIYEAHKDFGKKLEEEFKDQAAKAKVDPDFDKRKIRVGYLSQDFRSHSVAYFLEPLLFSHNRSLFEIFCYCDNSASDATTKRFKKLDTVWRPTSGLSSEELDELIRSDKIDILVDLGAYTGVRMSVFARRPAPVQMTYLGYINTTGLTTIDYLLSDEVADPPGSERFHTEKIARVNGCSLCYAPPAGAPDPVPPPALQKGYFTFGSFNNYAKMNDEVIETWAQILKAAPNSRLIIKNKSMNDQHIREGLIDKFKRQGIEDGRVEARGYMPTALSHIAAYNEIDLALDTFPFSGVTTTCESLWMGAPVITLFGDRYTSRIASSILSAVSLNPFIAKNKDEYVAKAAFQVDNLEMLSMLRGKLREMMASSSLCDMRGLAAQVEALYISFLKNKLEEERA